MQNQIDNNVFETPMMKQYFQIKEQYPDCLLFFRLGDFYELFMEDAKIGSQILDITLTSRDRGKDGRVPMCGVPYHAVDSYLNKLVKAGYKVAICEQMTEPGKGLVEREVVRVVTPGTMLDEKSLEKKENNYLVALEMGEGKLGLAFSDISTGSFHTIELEIKDNLDQVLTNELSQINPSECILSDHLYNNIQLLKALRKHKNLNIFRFNDWGAYSKNSEDYLKKHFKVSTLNGLGLSGMKYAIKAASVLLGYLKQTQKDNLEHLNKINVVQNKGEMALDRATIVNLELFSTIRDSEKTGSLINLLDNTSTSMGGRKLKQWLIKPLINEEDITNRYDAVEYFLKNRQLRIELINTLSHVTDFERITSKLAVGIGNARDLVNLKEALKLVLKVESSLKESEFKLINSVKNNIPQTLQHTVDLIEDTIVDEPPLEVKNGNLIKSGVDQTLDDLKDKISESTTFLNELETKERERTGISSLKVKYNMVFGYYIEVTKANLDMVPKNYFRKQTLVNAERFFTKELKEHEEIILSAKEKINNIEYQLFLNTVEKVLKNISDIQSAGDSISIIDCLLNFAELAEKENYTRPQIINTGEIEIKQARHPVVEKLLEIGKFVPNDIYLNTLDHQLLILTGPNMAGKSVYIRQAALIVLLAQIGCFVPTQSARITLCDRIFVRSGASDVITSGLSTFMVEMTETAYILNNATDKSLIVMDEIGRGTSTYDGISIAWAIAEYLINCSKACPKTLFATHYHELQKLEDKYPQKIKNFQVLVGGTQEDPVFLHKVTPGAADHSYGIAVAKLSGVPKEVTENAYSILKDLEQRNGREVVIKDKQQECKSSGKGKKFERIIHNIDISSITPLQALNILAEIKEVLEDPA